MTIEVTQLDKKKIRATARQHSVQLDQGPERGGDDAGFRPTELWLIGLSSCSAGTLTGIARRLGYPLEHVRIEAEEGLDEKNAISSVTFRVHFKGPLLASHKEELLREVKATCKVVKTVHPSIRVTFLDAEEAAGSAAEGEASCCTI